jgi:hypothetical protein
MVGFAGKENDMGFFAGMGVGALVVIIIVVVFVCLLISSFWRMF